MFRTSLKAGLRIGPAGTPKTLPEVACRTNGQSPRRAERVMVELYVVDGGWGP